MSVGDLRSNNSCDVTSIEFLTVAVIWDYFLLSWLLWSHIFLSSNIIYSLNIVVLILSFWLKYDDAMEILSPTAGPLWANPPVTEDSPYRGPVTQILMYFLSLNNLLDAQSFIWDAITLKWRHWSRDSPDQAWPQRSFQRSWFPRTCKRDNELPG